MDVFHNLLHDNKHDPVFDDMPSKYEMVADLFENKTTLLAIVDSLNPTLTSGDVTVRQRGVELLSSIICEVSPLYFQEKELGFFADFYIDRLSDYYTVVPPSLRGILALVRAKNLSAESATTLLEKIFRLVTCQAHTTPSRKILYEIYNTCFEMHYASVEKMGPDFLSGVLAAMDGETDPINLKFLFSFMPEIIRKLNIIHLTEQVFDVFSIYFPIDFTTVKKDNVLITREELSLGLSYCLTVTPELSAKSLLMALEKVEAALKAAKIDSYKLIYECCQTIDWQDLEKSLDAIWLIMQQDLVPVRDEDVQQEALRAISAICTALKASQAVSNEFLDNVINFVRTFTNSPLNPLFPTAFKIYEAIVYSSQTAEQRVYFEIHILTRPKKRTDSELTVLLTAIAPFLSDERANTMFIPTLCYDAIQAESRSLQAAGFIAFEKLYPVLTVLGRCKANQVISSQVSLDVPLSPEFEKFLMMVALSYPHHFQSIYNDIEYDLWSKKCRLQLLLDISALVCEVPHLTERMLYNYTKIAKTKYASAAIDSLLNAARDATPQFLRELYPCVMPIVSFNKDKTDLGALAELLKISIACHSSFDQRALINSTEYPIFYELPRCSAILMEGALAGLHPEIHETRFTQLIPRIKSLALNHPDPDERLSAGRLLANFCNKFPINEAKTILNNASADLSTENSVELFGWVLKGAILRGIPQLEDYMEKWFSLFDDPALSHIVLSGIEGFLIDEPAFLNKSCHCTVKLFHRQRLFAYVPRLLKSLPDDRELRINFLTAGLKLTAGVPRDAILTDQNSVAILLSHAFKASESSVIHKGLKLLRMLLITKHNLFSNHMTSILPPLLKLMCPPYTLPVRQVALNCLFLFAFYPTHLTLPYKTQVIQEMLACLDDRKRIVRSEAARARGRWYLIGTVADSTFSETVP